MEVSTSLTASQLALTKSLRRNRWYLAIFLVACFGATWGLKNYLTKKELVRSEDLHIKIVEDFRLAFKQYLHPLQGIASTLHYANLELSPSQFRKGAESRDLFRNFEGALGFGFIRKVASKDLDTYIKARRVERPSFQLKWLESSLESTIQSQQDIYVIEVVEPVEANIPAVGLVISDESRRKQAAKTSMLTGEPTITQSINLVQAARKEPGFLYFLPIYAEPNMPTKEQDREAKIFGWAYTPLLLSEIVKFVLSLNIQHLPFSVYELVSGEEKLLFKTEEFESVLANNPMVFEDVVEVAGQTWKFRSLTTGARQGEIYFISALVFMFLSSLGFVIYSHINTIHRKFYFNQQLVERSEQAVELATKELNDQKSFLRFVIDEIPSMIGYWDRDLKNRLSNSAYETYFSKKPNEIMGIHIGELLPKPIYDRNLPFLLEALKGNPQEFERELVDKTGQKRLVYARYLPHNVNGEVLGITVIVDDITERRRLEVSNSEAQAMLFSKSKLSLLGEMAGGIAHEINNPLAIISGKARVIQNLVAQPSDSIAEEMRNKIVTNLEGIDSTVKRIASIIKGLRSFARDSDGDPYETVRLADIISDVLALTQEKLSQTGIKLTIVGADLDVAIKCNQTQIVQVVMNLISNSIDAVTDQKEKWVQVSISQDKDKTYLRVTNSGLGIDLAVVEKIMNPFFTTKEVGKGVGLGLSISRGIAQKHGGNLEYQLYQGNTSFLITLPRVRS